MLSQPVLTVDQMRAAEKAAMDNGITEWELMQRAGEGAAQWVARMAGGRSVCVLCGPGNNGGDGYVIAESLRKRGLSVAVVAPKEPGSETARTARERYRGQIATGALPEACVYVDCLFGYGLSRKVEGGFAALLASLRDATGYKIAIDVPSSVASDTGELLGPEVNHDLTIAFGAWKRAHFTMPAMALMGAKRLVDIGIDFPDDASRTSSPPCLTPPAGDAHKYTRGLLAIVAGEMPGAPLLAAQAAMRSGSGYVKLLSEHSHPDAPAELVIDDRPLADALDDKRIGALLIGPGLGRGEAARERLGKVLSSGAPVVLDADALHLLDPSILDGRDVSKIAVTPHEGELAALCDTFQIKGDAKFARAEGLHAVTGMTVLAKGPDSVVARADCVRYFEQGSSWLSAAGTGDVLAGIAASRLAVHGEPQRALEEAVWIHHEAARLAGPAFTSGQLAQAVKPAMETFL